MVNPKKLVRRVLPRRGVRIAEEAYRRGRIYALQGRYGFPTRGLRIIGVTGTNGKTTTSILLNEILKRAGYKTALISTAVIEIAGKTEVNRNHRTVPLTAELLQLFKLIRSKKVDFVILEVTSQALHQHKLSGIPIEVAVMTNLTQDHLDYHGTMQNYAMAKARLFDRYCDPDFVVLNHDDDWYQFFADLSVGQELSYGKQADSTLQLTKTKLSGDKTQFEVAYGQVKTTINLRLPGEFNVFNALAAISAALAVGVSLEKAAKGAEGLKGVAGRMERIESGQPFTVLVDYAVTPDALEKVLIAARLTAKNNLRVVFGATGDRDKNKRPSMGQIAARLADFIYLTDDETYTEDPEAIRKEVLAGIKKAKGQSKTKVIADRENAIKTAFQDAKKGDVVLITGMGHQNTRNMGGHSVPWDDRQIARKILKKIR